MPAPHTIRRITMGPVSSLIAALLSLGIVSQPSAAEPIVAQLSTAPSVPPALNHKEPAHVIVKLHIEEKVADLSEGIQYEFWTYNGNVPGPFIRIRQGDTFEV